MAAVLVGPGGVRVRFVAPAQGDAQLRIAIQAGLALFVQRRALREPVEDADGRRLFLDPVAQPHPHAHEALVRDVDDGGVGERHLRRRHEEGHARLAERLDDRREFGGRDIHDLREPAERLRAADAAVLGLAQGERLEHRRAELPRAVRAEAGVKFIRMSRQRLAHPPDGVVVLEVEGAHLPEGRALGVPSFPLEVRDSCNSSLRAAPLPLVPRPHEGVLEAGQLIRLITEVVEQSLQQARREGAAGDADGAFDGALELLAGHPRDQVFAAVHGLGEVLELRAVADEIRAHGEHDVDRHVLLRGRLEQHAHELVRRVALGRAALVEAEDLLELIDDEQEVRARRELRLADGLDEAEVAARERGEQAGLGVLLRRVVQVRREQRLGEMIQGRRAGMRDGNFPARAGREHLAAEQLREQAAAHERGLAAAGRADHRDEAVRTELLQQLHRLLLAAEEEVVLLRRERAQTGERIVGAVGLVHAVTPFNSVTNASSSVSGWNSAPWRMTRACSERKRSLR